VAALICGNRAEIVFTGSGSEAANLAVLASPEHQRQVITQATEYPPCWPPATPCDLCTSTTGWQC
jgi:cysteine sulfinate desulfinase/cysteine desulfurase-like protein